MRYSTDCRWCYVSTKNGAEYCDACEKLRCDYCGFVYFDVSSNICENCRAGESVHC